MDQVNAERLLDRIPHDATVLDIGGWVQPFNRADWIVDVMPFDTRGSYGSLGRGPERFTRDTWIIHDISSQSPLPFEDNQFDFVVCSHTLEDIRDPIRGCAEIARVGKAGYIEVPSRVHESIWGIEHPAYVGHSHHRWLADIEDGQLTFRFKWHLIHGDRRFHLPKRWADRLTPEDHVIGMFWDGTFEYREAVHISRHTLEIEYEAFIRSVMGDEFNRWTLPRNLRELNEWLRRNERLRRLLGRGAREVGMWYDMPEIESKD